MGILKKLILIIIGGTTSLIIAACYGVQSVYDTVIRLNTTDQDGEVIQGLQVQSVCGGDAYELTYTDEEGDAHLSFGEYQDIDDCVAEITDIDGADNGGEFESKTVPLHDSAEGVFVTMEPVTAD